MIQLTPGYKIYWAFDCRTSRENIENAGECMVKYDSQKDKILKFKIKNKTKQNKNVQEIPTVLQEF